MSTIHCMADNDRPIPSAIFGRARLRAVLPCMTSSRLVQSTPRMTQRRGWAPSSRAAVELVMSGIPVVMPLYYGTSATCLECHAAFLSGSLQEGGYDGG